MGQPELGDQLDQFVLDAPLGQGGMARTFKAHETATGQTVVLKLPDPNQLGDAATFERFRRELTIAKRLNHPAIPHLVAARESGATPYLALEYVDGEPLCDQGTLPMPLIAAYARQLADLLAYLHQNGVVHRDLKPENILIDRDGNLHVIDFGIASMVGMPRVTWRGFSGLAGTPEYMAPEKIRGERGTTRVDIYAFGIILYVVLTGRVPFKSDHPLSTMYQHLEAVAPPILALRPETPPYLAAVIARCMRRRAKERYADGGALLRDLQNPSGVDLAILTQPDPPMGGSRSLKPDDNPLRFVLIAAGSGIGLALLLILLLYRHH